MKHDTFTVLSKMFGTVVPLVFLVVSVTSHYIEPHRYFYESEYATDCREIQKRGNTTSGVYPIKPDFYNEPLLVYCDMETAGGGWIRILNRQDGSQDFSLPWKYYKDGFGDLDGEFWLGLEHIHQFTRSEINELRIQLVDWDSVVYNLRYLQFSISGESDSYALQVLGYYTGELLDSLRYHVHQKFSTIDRDNDKHGNMTCTDLDGGGGWWYNACYQSQLTGNYIPKEQAIKGNSSGICWMGYHQSNISVPIYYSFKEARMMIKATT